MTDWYSNYKSELEDKNIRIRLLSMIERRN